MLRANLRVPARREQHVNRLLCCLQAREFAVEGEQLPARMFEVDIGTWVASVDPSEHRAFLRVELPANILKPVSAQPLGQMTEPTAGLHA